MSSCSGVPVSRCPQDPAQVQLTVPAAFSLWKNPAIASAEETRPSARHSEGGDAGGWRSRGEQRKARRVRGGGFREADSGSRDSSTSIRQTKPGWSRILCNLTPTVS